MNFLQILVIALILLINLSFLGMMLGMMLGTSFGVPWVPSGKRTAQRMGEIAQIQPGQKVIDLGCGDGRLVFLSAKKGANALGIEFSPAVFLYAWIRNFFLGSKNSRIVWGNFFSPKFQKEIESADVIFAFLLPRLLEKIFTEIFPKMKPKARIISHAFSPKNIIPTQIFPRDSNHGKILVFEKIQNESIFEKEQIIS